MDGTLMRMRTRIFFGGGGPLVDNTMASGELEVGFPLI